MLAPTENTLFKAFDFTENVCANLVMSGRVPFYDGRGSRLCDAGRLASLLAMQAEFGRQKTHFALETAGRRLTQGPPRSAATT